MPNVKWLPSDKAHNHGSVLFPRDDVPICSLFAAAVAGDRSNTDGVAFAIIVDEDMVAGVIWQPPNGRAVVSAILLKLFLRNK